MLVAFFAGSAQQALLANIVPKEQLSGAVFILSAVLLICGLIAVWTIRYRQSEEDRARGNAADRPPVLVQLRDGFDYARHDWRVATVLVLVAFHCGLTRAFDSMMPTLSKMLGVDSGTYSTILIALGAGAVVGILVSRRFPARRPRGEPSSWRRSGVGSRR